MILSEHHHFQLRSWLESLSRRSNGCLINCLEIPSARNYGSKLRPDSFVCVPDNFLQFHFVYGKPAPLNAIGLRQQLLTQAERFENFTDCFYRPITVQIFLSHHQNYLWNLCLPHHYQRLHSELEAKKCLERLSPSCSRILRPRTTSQSTKYIGSSLSLILQGCNNSIGHRGCIDQYLSIHIVCQ